MKGKRILMTLLVLLSMTAKSQNCYWVYLTDKNGSTFDPYEYFDAKAIERYARNGANLYDISNYPLKEEYVRAIEGLSEEEVGTSRWFNAVAVMAYENQIEAIESLPFVAKVRMIGAGRMQMASREEQEWTSIQSETRSESATAGVAKLTDQLIRMGGQAFKDRGIDGRGVRVAIFDGGFPNVDKHSAFKHLRENGQIIKTWDFTRKKENVYYSGTHGTMTLSCITGVVGDKQLGLATGATFLLAKTEIEAEPYKEEVWWTQAMEWADKNGADVINSSLGYGKDRHYTYEMDGRSHVAKAASMAAAKGMIVCNSAGNEGDDNKWKTIITPADAEEVLTVGGIESSLTRYKHIDFSSYGPTADKRMKPNVVAFGHAECADPHKLDGTEWAYGTSFSSPLTAGFVACALQAVREKKLTAMELKKEVEKSGDLYPYYDYAFGYGVPQAEYFVGENKVQKESFEIVDLPMAKGYIAIHPLTNEQKSYTTNITEYEPGLEDRIEQKTPTVFIKISYANGYIDQYRCMEIDDFNTGRYIAISKGCLVGKVLTVHYNGTTKAYELTSAEKSAYIEKSKDPFQPLVVDTAGMILSDNTTLKRDQTSNKTRQWGVGQKWTMEMAFQCGMLNFFTYDNMKYCDGVHFGFRWMRNFKKWYSLGYGIEVGGETFRYKPKSAANVWDNQLGIGSWLNGNVSRKHFYYSNIDLELFQRIRIVGGGVFHKGLHWDIGVYGGVKYTSYKMGYNDQQTPNSGEEEHLWRDVKPSSDNVWDLGLTTRLSYDWIGIYARYRLNQPDIELPKWEMGVQITL